MQSVDLIVDFDIENFPGKGYMTFNKGEYIVQNLKVGFNGNKGGNSHVFLLISGQSETEDDSYVIKISNNTVRNGEDWGIRNLRFKMEVEALEDCLKKKAVGVVKIYQSGTIRSTETDKVYPYYIMERADCDLKDYMESHDEFDLHDRVEICIGVVEAINALSELGYYHRDIKPDNIFLVSGRWKIGDLGLVSKRDREAKKEAGKFVGPRGWISPEAMNNFIVNIHRPNGFDRVIDSQSDIFQLGKVFWYIMQGNAPIGCVDFQDFRPQNSSMYDLIHRMLEHDKSRRISTFVEVKKILIYIAKNV